MPDIDNESRFIGHLIELRKRLIRSSIAVAIGFAIAYYYSDWLYAILTKPLLSAMPKGQEYLVFTGVVEPFFIYMKVGFFGALVLASPVIFYQIWAFVAPALQLKEKAWFLGIVFSSSVLFIAGVLFAYYVVFPFGFIYLLSFATDGLKPMLSMSDYFSLSTKLLVAFGLTFQLPLAMMVLARFGLVTAKKFLSWWRYAIVIIFIVSAVLTPTPDIFNQLLMAAPLIVLYAVGIVAASIVGRKRE